jgi:hypothetical protein
MEADLIEAGLNEGAGRFALAPLFVRGWWAFGALGLGLAPGSGRFGGPAA